VEDILIMRPLIEMDTIQIEITNACIKSCSNCTRFCGHYTKDKMYGLNLEQFREAIDSLAEFPNMVGIMGGEPLLHPYFEQFCEYALSKIPRERLGLWSAFPLAFKKYREVIVRTFGNVFLNDHTINDIYHAPLLVGANEVIKDEADMWLCIERCWLQKYWSACINPNGAFFCEVAGAFSLLYNEFKGWKVEKGWWKRIPKDYREQMEAACVGCGAALLLKRRASIEEIDDVSPLNLVKLQKVNSPKVEKGLYKVSDLVQIEKPEEMFRYKDNEFRQRVANKFDIFLSGTDKGFLEPHLRTSKIIMNMSGKTLFEQYKEKYHADSV
jgi:hypothetical protein